MRQRFRAFGLFPLDFREKSLGLPIVDGLGKVIFASTSEGGGENKKRMKIGAARISLGRWKLIVSGGELSSSRESN